MAAPVVSVTVEDLDVLLADGTYDTCKGRVLLTLFGWRTPSLRCHRKAVAVITVTCSRDGSYTRGICRKHLRTVRAHPEWVACGACGERASWSAGGA